MGKVDWSQVKEEVIDYYSDMPERDMIGYSVKLSDMADAIVSQLCKSDLITDVGAVDVLRTQDVYLNEDDEPVVDYKVFFKNLGISLDVYGLYSGGWYYYRLGTNKG